MSEPNIDKNKLISLSEVNSEGSLIKNFCESTSLHGFSFLSMANSVHTKLVWILAIISMTVVGAVFLMRHTNDFMNSRLVTNIESSTATLSVIFFFTFFI